jgi:phosphatidate cytidylyltransferase
MKLSSNFIQRLFVSLFLGTIFCGVIYLSHDPLFQPLFVLIVALVIGGALWEYYHIAKVNGHVPVDTIGIVGSIAYLYVLYLTMGQTHVVDWSLMTLSLTLFSAFLYYFFSGISPFVNLAITVFGVVYLTIPLSVMILIDIDYGRYWMFYLLLVTKSTDIGAYFVGKQWGRHKLAPVISPRKTWEGAIAGFLLGTFTSYIFHKFSLEYYGVPLFDSSLQSLGFGALMAIVAQAGDLSESLLKRDSGVKDSNRLPGLGGLLDMVDSLVFTAPLLYFFLKLILTQV